MMRLNKLIMFGLIGAGIMASLNSCKKVENPTLSDSSLGGNDYSNGVLIVNEGTFGAGNGSISFFNYSSKNVFNTVFKTTNNRPLGDVAQSIIKSGNSTYICVNSSNKIEVVNSTTFKEEATITSIPQPRFMVTNGTSGYVSCWNNGGEIKVIDLTSNSVTQTISVGSGPEKMAISNGNLYVTNSGGFGADSTISVVNLASNTVTTTISIDAYNPSAIVNGSGNTLWAIAKGRIIYDVNWAPIGHDPAKLIEIDASTNTVISTTVLFAEKHPSNIDISPDLSTLYFGGSFGFPAIYSTYTSNPSTPASPFINEVNYGFFVNSSNGNIFILQEASTARGKLLRYNPSGSKIGEYSVGVFPTGGSNRVIR